MGAAFFIDFFLAPMNLVETFGLSTHGTFCESRFSWRFR